MKASFVIPTRNEESVIERCLWSIFDQTYRNFEVIVVDSSTDKTPKLAAKYDVTLVHQKPHGVAAAFSEGIRRASGDVICVIGADDFIASDYLERNLDSFLNPKAMGVFPLEKYVRPNTFIGKVVYEYRRLFHSNKGYSGWPKLWRREVFDKIPFDETLNIGEDIDHWKRVKKIATKEHWVFEYGSGIYYFADVDDSLVKNFKKSLWYGYGFLKRGRKDIKYLFNIFPIIFFSSIPLIMILYLLTHSHFYLLLIITYIGSWFLAVLKALAERKFTRYVLFIPLLLIWRALGHMVGVLLSIFKPEQSKSV